MERGSDPSSRAAAGVLERVFAGVTPGLQYRLWDGSEGRVGAPDGSYLAGVRDDLDRQGRLRIYDTPQQGYDFMRADPEAFSFDFILAFRDFPGVKLVKDFRDYAKLHYAAAFPKKDKR